MAPVTKDSVEIAAFNNNTAGSSTGTASKQGPGAGGHLRADAISLEVPVKVHGSRVTETAHGVAPRSEPFEEQTNSMIVFPQGGVLRMSTAVAAGQMLVVTNLKSRQDAICRVIKVRTFTNMQGYVEVEFTHKQPGYWGTRFPSDGLAAENHGGTENSAAAPLQSGARPETNEQAAKLEVAAPAVAPATQIAPAPAPVIAPPVPVFIPYRPAASVPASKPEPSFISIGTQEKVQPAATSTSFVSAPERVKPLPAVRPIQPVRIESDLAEIPAAKNMSAVIPAGIESDFPSAQATLRSELSLDDLRGEGSETIEDIADDNTGVAVEEQEQASGALRAENAHGTFVNLSGGGSLDIAKFQETGGQEQRPVQRGWVPFAADVFVTLAVVLGAIFFYRDRLAFPANSSAPTQNSTVVPQPLVFQSPSAVSGDAASSGTASATPTRNSATNPTTIEPQSNPAAGGPAAARPTAVPKQTARVTADMMQQTLEQHPVAPSRSESSGLNVAPSDDSAPAINSSISGSLTGIVSSNVPVLVAPSPRLEGPLKIGGNVKEPHLLTRVMPEYSLVAKEAGVQGDVIINTTIDQRGNVVNMQVVSGPQLLRGAALDALRRWKYQPSTLNGQPIAVQMLVTLKFSRR